MGKTITTDPRAEAIERLERIGVYVAEGSHSRWFVKRRRDGYLLPQTNPDGYLTEANALTAALAVCRTLLENQRDTDRAYREFVTVSSGRYTYADPSKFANQYRAQREYERVEACRLGLPVRPDMVAERGRATGK